MAAPYELTTWEVRLARGENALRAALVHPVLVWSTPPTGQTEPLALVTGPGGRTRPVAGSPVVYELKNNPGPKNPMLGITVGRTANNDVWIEDNSVSRFHAFLQDKEGWVLTDADSRNGTWVGPTRLTPRQAVPVGDMTVVRFGDVHMQVMLPDSFIRFLRRSSPPV